MAPLSFYVLTQGSTPAQAPLTMPALPKAAALDLARFLFGHPPEGTYMFAVDLNWLETLSPQDRAYVEGGDPPVEGESIMETLARLDRALDAEEKILKILEEQLK